MQNTVSLLLARDDKFAQIIELYGLPTFITRPAGFESLCLIILEQQVSLNSARASFNKLKALTGNLTSESITEMTGDEFRECGISRQKTTYLRGLAEAILEGNIDLDSFAHKDHDQVRAELVQLKGIGNWTADIYLMFSLQSPDILPLGDVGIVSAIKDIWGFTTLEEIIEHTENWKPYRTYSCFFSLALLLKKAQ